MDYDTIHKQAEAYLERKHDRHAEPLYLQLTADQTYGAWACFRLGEIYNRTKDIEKSRHYHEQAFERDPAFAKMIVHAEHPCYSYVYSKPTETLVHHCPLCGTEGKPYACYNTVTNADFISGFNPVRIWMHCDNCHHLFAHNYPENLGELLVNSAFDFNLNPKIQLFSIISTIMNHILKFTPGYRLLEVGVGAGEMTAVAKEFLFDVTGIDIRPIYAVSVSQMLDIPVYSVDFQDFETDQPFDVLCMGDVIEHMTDPVTALQKANSLLAQNGVLWLSTPNFDSAVSMVRKDRDPMWRVIEHLNYFSFRSLHKVLEHCGFEVVEYRVSAHYSGSMEILAVKREDI